MVATHNAPFSMLWQFAGNATQCEIYSAQNTIDSLLRVEAALAQAQGEQGAGRHRHQGRMRRREHRP